MFSTTDSDKMLIFIDEIPKLIPIKHDIKHNKNMTTCRFSIVFHKKKCQYVNY